MLTDAIEDWSFQPRPGWHRRARCRGVGPAELTIERGETRRLRDIRDEFCSQCPTLGECMVESLGEPNRPTGVPIRAGIGRTGAQAMRRALHRAGIDPADVPADVFAELLHEVFADRLRLSRSDSAGLDRVAAWLLDRLEQPVAVAV